MARPKLGETATERLHVKMAAEEIEAIDNWRYSNRIPSRSEAVRRLCQMALRYDEQEPPLIAALKDTSAAISGTREAWRAALARKSTTTELLDVVKEEYRRVLKATNRLMYRAQIARLQSWALKSGADMDDARRKADDKLRELEEALKEIGEN